MAIFREVKTTVYCDVCGEYIIGWKSKGQGVSRVWAAYYARSGEYDDEPIEKCKRCIACTSFDWDEEKDRLSI